jgi:uncharacterized protein (DUF1684 family)
MRIDAWEAQIERERRRKDAFFARDWQSPLAPQDRAGFRQLDYYPPDPDYRFEVELIEHAVKSRVTMAYTRGEHRDFVQWGEFRFTIGDKACVLQAYKSDAEEERLFVPFRDATSGRATYGAGLYLDLNASTDRSPDGKWILDLNKAYNPWCAYSEDYTCPFVPQENWLTVPVRAGEKNYAKK